MLCIQDEDPVPFSFHVNLPEGKNVPSRAPTRVMIWNHSMSTFSLDHPTGDFTPEDRAFSCTSSNNISIYTLCLVDVIVYKEDFLTR